MCPLQIDYIDMQSETDGEYKWIFNYVDHFTKFCVLLPGKTKTAQETAEKLVFVFSLLSAPYSLTTAGSLLTRLLSDPDNNRAKLFIGLLIIVYTDYRGLW